MRSAIFLDWKWDVERQHFESLGSHDVVERPVGSIEDV
jgi:hypothetical protein